MQLAYIFVVIAAALVQAAPAPDSDAPMVAKAALEGVAPQACLPASCQSFGCCSGNCGYWCRACDIKYTC